MFQRHFSFCASSSKSSSKPPSLSVPAVCTATRFAFPHRPPFPPTHKLSLSSVLQDSNTQYSIHETHCSILTIDAYYSQNLDPIRSFLFILDRVSLSFFTAFRPCQISTHSLINLTLFNWRIGVTLEQSVESGFSVLSHPILIAESKFELQQQTLTRLFPL